MTEKYAFCVFSFYFFLNLGMTFKVCVIKLNTDVNYSQEFTSKSLSQKKFSTKFKILNDENIDYNFQNSLKNFSDKQPKTNKKTMPKPS